MMWFKKRQPVEWQRLSDRWTLNLTSELRAVAWFSGNEEGDPPEFKGGIENRATGRLDPRYLVFPSFDLEDAKLGALTLYRVGPTCLAPPEQPREHPP
jgi:hypothetical protein